MSRPLSSFTPTIGLEVHLQLLTKRKFFSHEKAAYGQWPNRQTSPITLAYPGALPMLNKAPIDCAIKLGLACGAKIRKKNWFARKNYFYGDLSKGYQITQDKAPICQGGALRIIDHGEEKKITLTRMHLEEDTAKSLHNLMPGQTLLDFNRSGIPLLEIVTEPVIHTPEEAYAFLLTLRRLVRYLKISTGNMEEGSLRCDVNISVSKDPRKLGQRVEVKNLNSASQVKLAILHEIERQSRAITRGEAILSETRGYDPEGQVTHHLRHKESLEEYRYFPEPDLSPFEITSAWLARLQAQMPLLPDALRQRFKESHGLPEEVVTILLEEEELALFYTQVCTHTTLYKAVANFLIGPIKSHLNEEKKKLSDLALLPAHLALLVGMIHEGKLSFSLAVQRLLPRWLAEPKTSPQELAERHELLQETRHERLLSWVQEVLEAHPDKVAAYRAGKQALLQFFMGQVIRTSQGKASPQQAQELLKELLKEEA